MAAVAAFWAFVGSGFTGIDNYLIGPDGPLECLHRTPKRIFEVR